jgi:hypothetical protein
LAASSVNLDNGNSHVANGSTILVPGGDTNDICRGSILDLEVVGLGSPRAIPIDVANFFVPIEKVERPLSPAGSIRSSTRLDSGFASRFSDQFIDIGGCNFFVFVTVLVKLAPIVSE